MFFISCFQKVAKDDLGWLDVGDASAFGFVETLDEAKKIVHNNSCDIRECYYTYALVEEINSGLYPIVEHRWFFKWNDEREGFFEIEEPEEFRGCNKFAF